MMNDKFFGQTQKTHPKFFACGGQNLIFGGFRAKQNNFFKKQKKNETKTRNNQKVLDRTPEIPYMGKILSKNFVQNFRETLL